MPENNQEDLKFQMLLAKKEKQEQDLWFQKGVIKVIEVTAFLGMFLCKNPTGYRISVIIAAFAVLCDFSITYADYCNQKEMERLLNPV